MKTIPPIRRKIDVITFGATGNVDPGQMLGHEGKITNAYTLSLPSAVQGYWATFFASTAAVYSLALQTATDIIILNGTALTAGNKATSDGTIRNRMVVVSTDDGYYEIISILGVASDGGA